MADAPGLGGNFFQLNRWNRARVRGPKRKRVPKIIGGPVVTIRGVVIGMGAKALEKALAAFLASALGRELALRARDAISAPDKERVTDEELMREIEEWVRSQAAKKTTKGGKKGLALPLKSRGRPERGERSQPGEGPRRKPVALPLPVLDGKRPGDPRKREEPPEEESFQAWFERRFARSIVRHQRLRRRRKK